MALRSLLGRAKTSCHGHLKTKFLGPINNQNHLCGSSYSYTSSGRHMSSPYRNCGLFQSFQMLEEYAAIHKFAKTLAWFAVEEYNATQNADLQFVRVIHESSERDDSKLILQTIVEKIDPGAGAENDVRVLKIYTKEGDKLVRVLSATELSAASFMHHIKMEAIDAGKPKIFKAVVWVDRIRNLFILYELRPISDASGISGIKHQGYSSHEVSSSNPTASASHTRNSHLSSSPQHSSHETSSNPAAPASRTFKTSRYDESKMNSGFIKCWDAANSDQIRNYAQFAVNEYNDEQDVRLEFVRVLEASCHACGETYRIKLEAMDDGKLGIYLAEVWLPSWRNSIELTNLIFADNAS